MFIVLMCFEPPFTYCAIITSSAKISYSLVYIIIMSFHITVSGSFIITIRAIISSSLVFAFPMMIQRTFLRKSYITFVTFELFAILSIFRFFFHHRQHHYIVIKSKCFDQIIAALSH